jgi:hypothetical protein
MLGLLQQGFQARQETIFESLPTRISYFLCFIILLISIFRLGIQVFSKFRGKPNSKNLTIGFCGMLVCLFLGLLAFLFDLSVLLRAIKRFGSVDPSFLAGSFADTLRPLIFGATVSFAILLLSLVSRAVGHIKDNAKSNHVIEQ